MKVECCEWCYQKEGILEPGRYNLGLLGFYCKKHYDMIKTGMGIQKPIEFGEMIANKCAEVDDGTPIDTNDRDRVKSLYNQYYD